MTQSALQNKSARVLIIDSVGSFRPTVMSVLKNRGFDNIMGMSSIFDALNYIAENHVDWIITQLCPKDKVNAMQLLKLCISVEELQNTQVTLLVNEDEVGCLPMAMSLGLMSWIRLPLTRNLFEGEVDLILKSLDEFGGDFCLTAAKYARQVLLDLPDFKGLQALEESLAQLYPSQHKQLLNLLEAKVLNKDLVGCKAVLNQIECLAPNLTADAKAVIKRYSLDIENAEASNKLGVNSVLVVDPDESSRGQVKTYFKELGVENVIEAVDGKVGLELLNKAEEKPGLIIQEWKLPELSGANFLQRVRQSGHHEVPIIVMSSKIKDEHKAFTDEMGVAGFLNKPVGMKSFTELVKSSLSETFIPTKEKTTIQKIFALFAAGKRTEAQRLCEYFIKNKRFSEKEKKLVEAEMDFHLGKLESARDKALSYVNSSRNETVRAFNLLGRTFMKLNDHKNAVKCFEKAQMEAPENVSRVSQLAEAYEKMGDAASSDKFISDAAGMDAQNDSIYEASAKIAIDRNDIKGAKGALKELQFSEGFVRSTNNQGVALVLAGDVHKAIKLYEKVLVALPDNMKDVFPIIAYNLALAQCRAGNSKKAKILLDKIISYENSRVYLKAKSLLKRVADSIAANKKVVLKLEKAVEAIAEDESFDLEAHVNFNSLRPGEKACYQIFEVTSRAPKQVLELIKTVPRFKLRRSKNAA